MVFTVTELDAATWPTCDPNRRTRRHIATNVKLVAPTLLRSVISCPWPTSMHCSRDRAFGCAGGVGRSEVASHHGSAGVGAADFVETGRGERPHRSGEQR